jgi:serine/threonine-protein kinase HipA
LIGAGDEIRLGPLYDLSSQLPYPELIDQRLAMKIGDEYDIPLIGSSEWHALASACALDSALLMSRVRQLADALPGAVSAARDQALADGLDREVVTTLAELLIQHANARRATLNAAGSKHRRSRKIPAPG